METNFLCLASVPHVLLSWLWKELELVTLAIEAEGLSICSSKLVCFWLLKPRRKAVHFPARSLALISDQLQSDVGEAGQR